MQQKIKNAEEYADTEGVSPQFLKLLKSLDKRRHCTFYLKLSPEEGIKFVYGTYVGLTGKEPHLVLMHPKKYLTKNNSNIASGMVHISALGASDESEHCHIAFDNIQEDTAHIRMPQHIIVAERTKYEGRTYAAVNLFTIKAARIHDENGEFLCEFKLDFNFAEN